jgi:pilus assembly protein Flp/PilA
MLSKLTRRKSKVTQKWSPAGFPLHRPRPLFARSTRHIGLVDSSESNPMRHATAFLRDERAATAIEYGLIVTGIAIGTLAALSGIGAKIKAAFLLLQAAV